MDTNTLDLLPSVDALQDHLAAHDTAVRQIIMLDEYIERLSEQSVQATLDGQMSPSFRSMIRISVAEGLKRMYKEYRLHKWLKVQEMAATVRTVLAAAGFNNDDIQPARILIPSQQQQPAPPALPLLSPIITPQRVLSPATQVPAQGQGQVYGAVMNEQLFSPQRQLFPEDSCPAQLTECVMEGVSEDSAMDDSFVDDDDMSGQIQQNPVYTVPQQLPQNYMPQTAPAPAGVTPLYSGPTYQQQEYQVPQPGYMTQPHLVPGFMTQPQPGYESSEESFASDGNIDWDTYGDDEDDFDENIAHVLFAAEQLLPEQQALRLDVEMGDAGIGHLLFDRVNATWYTHHCEFHRGH